MFEVLLTSSLPFSVASTDSESKDSANSSPPPYQFNVEDRLKPQRNFWVDIYTKYDIYHGLIHDGKYVDHIYEVVDTRGHRGEGYLRKRKKYWYGVLMSLHHKIKRHGNKAPDDLTTDEDMLNKLYADINEPNKFLNAAHRKRLRFQLGQKDYFISGYKQAGRYLPIMEEIFKKNGLPTELTRLPFVESSFNIHARSKVGASGIWQFMRSTGKSYLKINDAIDERNDPIRATEAAVKLMESNFKSLKNWPLAVTAYNHGRMGLMRAERRVGSDDLADILESYHSRSFGFASSNFFTELCGAIEAEKNADKYFGKLDRLPVDTFFEFKMRDYMEFKDVVKFFALDREKLRDLNPALMDSVFKGRRRVPAGYLLRMPYDGGLSKEVLAKNIQEVYAKIPSAYRFKTQKTGYVPAQSTGRKHHKRAKAST